LDGYLGVEPRRTGIALAEGLCNSGEVSLWLKASTIGDRLAMALFIYILAFALRLTKITDDLRFAE
jgi:hypothetical protein